MSDFKIGDTVRCTATWTTHVVESGREYTVDDVYPPRGTILVNDQWVPVGYFEKVEPAISWAEIAGTMTARAVNAEQRAEKAESEVRRLAGSLVEVRNLAYAHQATIARVEALLDKTWFDASDLYDAVSAALMEVD